MALAHARYGLLLRSIPVEMAGKFSATMTAEAEVVLAAALYFGLDTKVSWPGPACSIPATAVISVSGEALSRRALRAVAMSASFIVWVRENCNRTGPRSYVSGLRKNRSNPFHRESQRALPNTEDLRPAFLLLEQRDLPCIRLAAFAAAVGGSNYC